MCGYEAVSERHIPSLAERAASGWFCGTMTTSSCFWTGTAVNFKSSCGLEQNSKSTFRCAKSSNRCWVMPVWKVKRISFSGYARKKSAARCGTNSIPSGRTKPRRISPEPRALRCKEAMPSSSVESVCSAHDRNSLPNGVSMVFLPFFSNNGTPSSFSICAMAWLRLGCVMQSCSAALV